MNAPLLLCELWRLLARRSLNMNGKLFESYSKETHRLLDISTVARNVKKKNVRFFGPSRSGVSQPKKFVTQYA